MNATGYLRWINFAVGWPVYDGLLGLLAGRRLDQLCCTGGQPGSNPPARVWVEPGAGMAAVRRVMLARAFSNTVTEGLVPQIFDLDCYTNLPVIPDSAGHQSSIVEPVVAFPVRSLYYHSCEAIVPASFTESVMVNCIYPVLE